MSSPSPLSVLSSNIPTCQENLFASDSRELLNQDSSINIFFRHCVNVDRLGCLSPAALVIKKNFEEYLDRSLGIPYNVIIDLLPESVSAEECYKRHSVAVGSEIDRILLENLSIRWYFFSHFSKIEV